ncbi:unnamed protein product [Brassica oleracea]|uniref:uncharacterized protein LOC106311149 isoform X4 n=1 Tax=Brassica oleracea var. oleracea TaxID=109376 RepID=UPI0006A6D8E2|nr:PREDICTED: uncharacterized protein LOC106311149 isoform X4 [Brassica oleracea var. oleracea]
MTAATTFRGRLTSGKTTNLVMVVTTVDSKIFQENIYLDSNLGVAAIVATRDETMAGIQKRRTGVDCRSSHLPIVLSKSTDQLRSPVSYNKMSGLTFLAPVATGSWKNQGQHCVTTNGYHQMSLVS